jgi:hypothetical protein
MKRILRAWLVGGLGLVLAVAASAQVRVLPPQALAPIGVAPLLVGTPAAPAPALAAALSFQAQAVAALPVPAASAFLVERAASAEPAERAAAKIVAANLVSSEKNASVSAVPAAASDAGLLELAASARSDPSLAAWFDESKAAPSLELDELTLKRGTWRREGSKLKRLGQGEFGFVDAHPTMAGAVIKTVAHSPEIQLFMNVSPGQTGNQEEATARAGRGRRGAPSLRPSRSRRLFGQRARAGVRRHAREARRRP